MAVEIPTNAAVPPPTPLPSSVTSGVGYTGSGWSYPSLGSGGQNQTYGDYVAPQGGGVDTGTIFQTAMAQANALANAEVAGQTAPLGADIKSQQQMMAQTGKAIQSEFGQILPAVQTSAQQVQKFNQLAQGASQAIFQAAGQQLGSLAQNQAAQAQRTAQATGGPVSTGQFTASTDPYQQAEVASGAIDQLTTLNLGYGNDRSAQKFAGQVFPALEAEQLSSNRQKYQDQIKTLQDKIDAISATKSKLVAANLPGLIRAQQNYRLSQAQLKQKQIDDNRTWQINQRKLDQNDAQLAQTALQNTRAWKINEQTVKNQGKQIGLAIQKENFGEWAANYRLGQGDQRLTQEQAKIAQGWKGLKIRQGELNTTIQRLGDQEVNDAFKRGMSKKEYALKALHYTVSDKLAQQREDNAQTKNVMSFISGLTGGASSNKPISVTVKKYLSPEDPQYKQAMAYNPTNPFSKVKAPPNTWFDQHTGKWYTYVHQTMTPSQFTGQAGTSGTPVVRAQEMYDALKSAMPDAFKTKQGQAMVVGLINAKLNLNGWAPSAGAGSAASTAPAQPAYTAQSLSGLSLGDLTDVAVKLGFPQSPNKVSRQHLVDYVLAHQHKVS